MTRICRPRPRSPQRRVTTLFTRLAVTGKVSLRPNPCGNEGAIDGEPSTPVTPKLAGASPLAGGDWRVLSRQRDAAPEEAARFRKEGHGPARGRRGRRRPSCGPCASEVVFCGGNRFKSISRDSVQNPGRAQGPSESEVLRCTQCGKTLVSGTSCPVPGMYVAPPPPTNDMRKLRSAMLRTGLLGAETGPAPGQRR